jgi:hypothetical protein
MEENQLPLSLPHREPVTVVGSSRPREKAKSLFSRYEFLLVWVFLLVSAYLTLRVVGQLTRVASINTQHERSILQINQQLEDQAARLTRIDGDDRRMTQSLDETARRNGKIEARLTRIEEDYLALKRANDRILANGQQVKERLDRLSIRVGASPEALAPPPGTVVLRGDEAGEVWLVLRERQEHRLSPLRQTPEGVLVRDLKDGKEYILTSWGELLVGGGGRESRGAGVPPP